MDEPSDTMKSPIDQSQRKEVLGISLAPLFQEMFRCHQEQFEAAAAPLRAALEPILKQFQLTNEALRGIIGAINIGAISEAVRKTQQARPGVVDYMMECGWYPTYDFPDRLLIEIDSLRQAQRHGDVDAVMSDFARNLLDDTEQGLRSRFPHRAQVFADAFEAHRTGKYTLSIPALLAQIDGVGCELLGIPRQFFRSRSRTTAIQDKLSAFIMFGKPYVLRGVTKEMLDPLMAESSIGADTDERDNRQNISPWYSPLNRHGVLHGVDTDYPSESNSLRCVLLLRYLLNVDQILHEEIPDEVAKINAMWERAFAEEPSQLEFHENKRGIVNGELL